MKYTVFTKREIRDSEAPVFFDDLFAALAAQHRRDFGKRLCKFPTFAEFKDLGEFTYRDEYPGGYVETTYKIEED